MFRGAFLLIGLVLSSAALAEDDARFQKLKNGAEPLGGLGSFLDKFIGECGDPVTGAECRANANEFRRKARGKKFYMIITEEQANMLSPGRNFKVNITPFFPSSGYALTHGAPKRTDGNGNPVMSYLYAEGEPKEDWDESRFQRFFASRELRVQAVFTPQDVWTLPKKGGGRIYGVRAKMDAILVTHGRTGDHVALWTGR